MAALLLFVVWMLSDGVNTLYAFIGPVVLLVIGVLGKLGLGPGILPGRWGSFFGDAIRPLSEEWRSFFFGTLSQQHYPPFVDLPDRLASLVSLTNTVGVALLLSGVLLFLVATTLSLRRRLPPDVRPRLTTALALYCVSLAVIALHIAITQTTLYTQAKGAQDVLVVLYAGVLALPTALAVWSVPRFLRWSASAYTVLLALFIVGLLAPRAYFAWDLANGRDRSTILEPSYFTEAARIRQNDSSPFVLMEPAVNADIYLNIQPFFGARMLPTRHLSLSRIASVTRSGDAVNVQVDRDLYALDFVQPQDLQHLWTLQATITPHPDAHFPQPDQDRVWHASRVADTTSPLLLLAGNYYERFFTQKPRSSSSDTDLGWFSYLRGGAAALVLPPDTAASFHTITLRIQPESATDLPTLTSDVTTWLTQFAPPNHDPLVQDGQSLSITYHLQSSPTPQLVPLLRANATYLLNVRIDDIELKNSLVQVSAPDTARPGQAIQVAWRGLEQPAPDDWLAVFPAGGADATRITWEPTGGAANGSLGLPLPPTLPPGPYELRLYAHGTWTRLASTTFNVTP
jgi:hypothetical protein